MTEKCIIVTNMKVPIGFSQPRSMKYLGFLEKILNRVCVGFSRVEMNKMCNPGYKSPKLNEFSR